MTAPTVTACVRDDVTECDCPACVGDDLRWEHWQGWHAEHGEQDCPLCDAEDDGAEP